MRYRKSTRYALCATMELAAAHRPTSVAEVAACHAIPETALAKVLQRLVHAGIARGARGAGGGYTLARPAGEISLLDVIAACDVAPEPTRERSAGAAACGRRGPVEDRLRRLFAEVDEQERCTLASVSLETLLGGRTTR